MPAMRSATLPWGLPAAPRPQGSPLMSAANTATPASLKASARRCRVTVLPVPVAPAIRPWRLARRRAWATGWPWGSAPRTRESDTGILPSLGLKLYFNGVAKGGAAKGIPRCADNKTAARHYRTQVTMTQNLKFSHKILLAASLVVIVAFSLFSLYNDYLQRNAIRVDLEDELRSLGEVTAGNIQNWLSGRILLVENIAQSVQDDTPESLPRTLERKSVTSTFEFTYLGGADGSFTMRPDEEMPADYDPRTRPWYKDAMAAGGSTLTEPYVDAATGKLTITIASPAGSAGVI